MNKKPDDLEAFRIPESMLRQQRNGHKAKAAERYKNRKAVKWYKFEENVLDRAFATTEARKNAWPILAVLMALYERWFTDYDHRNPVLLTSCSLQRFGLMRKQKYRALQILESAKLILIERKLGKNPKVTIAWLPLQK